MANTIPYVFDYDTWIALFPEMQGVGLNAAKGYFTLATMYVRNDGSGPVRDPDMQATLLNLTTAHIAKLFSTQNNGAPTTGGAEAPNGIVGRISSAAEGSVNVQTEYAPPIASAAWWLQSSYGAAAWQLMAPFRTMRYLGPAHRRRYNPPARYPGNLGGI